jgi:hypothetical protein
MADNKTRGSGNPGAYNQIGASVGKLNPTPHNDSATDHAATRVRVTKIDAFACCRRERRGEPQISHTLKSAALGGKVCA